MSNQQAPVFASINVFLTQILCQLVNLAEENHSLFTQLYEISKYKTSTISDRVPSSSCDNLSIAKLENSHWPNYQQLQYVSITYKNIYFQCSFEQLINRFYKMLLHKRYTQTIFKIEANLYYIFSPQSTEVRTAVRLLPFVPPASPFRF